MKGFAKFTLTMIFGLLAAATAFAQMGMRGAGQQMHGVWNPVVGRGAAYDMQGSDGKKNSMEISIVGKESVDGKDAYWLEMSFDSSERGGQMVMKHLIVLDAGQTHAVKVIMQMPGQPPMEMPMQMIQRGGTHTADIRSDAQDVGSESITVPAGTFTSEHYKMKDGADVWVTREVSPWGMVKFQGKETTMVLTKVITDAKDKITGTPQPMNPRMMGQRPQ